mgnify:CR=1 FL=1
MNAINLRAIYSVFTRASIIFLLVSCTQEQQNKINRDIQNWAGTNGVLEVYAGDKLVRDMVRQGRMGTPGDVAQLAMFLGSDAASYISGTVIACDGGSQSMLTPMITAAAHASMAR